MFNVSCILAALALALAPETAPAPPPVSPAEQATLERMPEPVGGMAELGKAVKYPETACKEGVEGIVVVKVTLSATGEILKAEIGTSVRADLDQAALNAVKGVAWSPAKDSAGKNIELTFSVPINFKLALKI